MPTGSPRAHQDDDIQIYWRPHGANSQTLELSTPSAHRPTAASAQKTRDPGPWFLLAPPTT